MITTNFIREASLLEADSIICSCQCAKAIDNLITICYNNVVNLVIPLQMKCCYTINGDHTEEVHLFSFRTQKLSSSGSKVLAWRRAGRIERCRFSNQRCESISFFVQNFDLIFLHKDKLDNFIYLLYYKFIILAEVSIWQKK